MVTRREMGGVDMEFPAMEVPKFIPNSEIQRLKT